VGREVEVLHSPAERGGVSQLWADLSTARRLLNYEPHVQLVQGLRLTLEQDPRFQASESKG
jgi:nucleoside-diphosphate-sugar epimerase